MLNLNPYQEDEFVKQFATTNIYENLVKDFDIVSFSKFLWLKHYPTPRQQIGSKEHTTRFSAVSFYYLQYLLEKNPKEIYDLGCGWNIFKKYIPKVIGVGAEDPHSSDYHADIHDFVDDEYIRNHQNFFESVFSICALHFHPLSDFGKVINDFHSMICPGGRGYLALNLARMKGRDPFFENKNRDELEFYCRTELSKLTDINFLVVDVDLALLDEGMDGNVRLVVEK
jgi:hypothetical protein